MHFRRLANGKLVIKASDLSSPLEHGEIAAPTSEPETPTHTPPVSARVGTR